MGIVITLVAVVGLLIALALVMDLRDRKSGGRRLLARGGSARRARREDVVQNPQVGDQGGYLNLPSS